MNVFDSIEIKTMGPSEVLGRVTNNLTSKEEGVA
jgi:hypothetical protein